MSLPPGTLKSATVAALIAKVKGLISDMIARLEEKASVDASQKAHCDKELSDRRAKK